MLIPFGVFSAAGAGGGAAAGAYELISTTVLGSNTTTVTLNSFPTGYKNLQLRMVARSSRPSATTAEVIMRVNGVSTASYTEHYLLGNGSSVVSGGTGTNGSGIGQWLGEWRVPASTAPTSAFGASVIDILDFENTSKNTTFRIFTGTPTQVALYSGAFLNTAAVSSLSFTCNVGDYLTGSRFSIYGLKG